MLYCTDVFMKICNNTFKGITYEKHILYSSCARKLDCIQNSVYKVASVKKYKLFFSPNTHTTSEKLTNTKAYNLYYIIIKYNES